MAETKLTPEVHEILVKAIENGTTACSACGLVGIDHSTFYNWLNRGKEGEEPFSTFSTDIKKAQSRIQIKYENIIDQAAESNWTAAAWWLERRRHKNYSRHERVEHGVIKENPLEAFIKAKLEADKDSD